MAPDVQYDAEIVHLFDEPTAGTRETALGLQTSGPEHVCDVVSQPDDPKADLVEGSQRSRGASDRGVERRSERVGGLPAEDVGDLAVPSGLANLPDRLGEDDFVGVRVEEP